MTVRCLLPLLGRAEDSGGALPRRLQQRQRSRLRLRRQQRQQRAMEEAVHRLNDLEIITLTAVLKAASAMSLRLMVTL